MIPLAGKRIAQSQCGGGLPARVGIIAVVLLHNALPVRYLILAPIVNLILAGLFIVWENSQKRVTPVHQSWDKIPTRCDFGCGEGLQINDTIELDPSLHVPKKPVGSMFQCFWFAEKRAIEHLLENGRSSSDFRTGWTGNVRFVGAGEHRGRLSPASSAFCDHLENRLSAVSLHVSRAGRGEVHGVSTGTVGQHLA